MITTILRGAQEGALSAPTGTTREEFMSINLSPLKHDDVIEWQAR
jgi:hypothetical protein